jgi:U3 small nucleolar RNA-associated protein 18
MSAGPDKTIRLFEIDGENNPKAQGVFLNDLPIFHAAFSPDGSQIIASGRRKYFYTFDLNQGTAYKVPGIKGRDEKSLESFILSPNGNNITFFGNSGHLMLVDMRSKNWIANLKMNGTLRAADYSGDGSELFSFGGDGEVYLWDVRTRRCRQKFFDEGCVQGTSLAVSQTLGGPQYLAAGSTSGVVNLYDRTNLHDVRPSPLKALTSITVPVDCMSFNADAQLFAWSASHKKQCLRVAHVASRTTYSNWPTGQTPLGHVSCLSFSPNSGYLAVGNHKGRVLLYRLNHFGSV